NLVDASISADGNQFASHQHASPRRLACVSWSIALRVRDVEFLRRWLSVSENAVQLGVNHAVGPTKGRKARSVPVPAFVLDELSVQCKRKAPGDLVFPDPGGGYLPRPKSSTGWFIAAVLDQGADHHAARSAAHVRVAGDQRRGERARAATDARAHQRGNDTRHVQRLVRRRSTRRSGHAAQPLLTRRCGRRDSNPIQRSWSAYQTRSDLHFHVTRHHMRYL
ncbi:MAG: hypothetical protein QOE94_839, partial [Mycobacterium sp.]|nr:hypothetical protein [Mycobacterium sp.]